MENPLTSIDRELQTKYYGKFRGFVVDNQDPENRARLRLRIPSVLGDAVSTWALPCLSFGGLPDQGWYAVPEIDAQVWVEFEEGNRSSPIWTGTFWPQKNQAPKEVSGNTTTRLFKTPSGHLLQFDDKTGEERFYLFHPSKAALEIDKNGTATLTSAGGNTLVLDANAGEIRVEDANGNTLTLTSSGTTVEDSNGNKLEMAAAGITVEGQKVVIKGTQVLLGGEGGEPVIKGQSFLSLFATHIHPTPAGPSSPPVPQGEMSSLSSKVMTS